MVIAMDRLKVVEAWRGFEASFCRCGTACGLLDEAPFACLLAFWVLRHSVYGLLLWAIWAANPSVIVWQLLGAFIIVNHSYKAWAYLYRVPKKGDFDDIGPPKEGLQVVVAQPREDRADSPAGLDASNNGRRRVPLNEIPDQYTVV